jgi:hypothetical protein
MTPVSTVGILFYVIAFQHLAYHQIMAETKMHKFAS